jgi:hypothetical protein
MGPISCKKRLPKKVIHHQGFGRLERLHGHLAIDKIVSLLMSWLKARGPRGWILGMQSYERPSLLSCWIEILAHDAGLVVSKN